jgi:DnaJ-class molecular chaperone
VDRPNYYEILGVSWDASTDDIARAYRQRALERHPDRNPNDPAAIADMQRIAEAAAMLRDPVKRSEYDRLVQHNYPPAGAPPAAQGMERVRCNWDAGDVEYRIRLTCAEAWAGISYTMWFHSAQGQPYDVAVIVPPGTPHDARIVIPKAGGPARNGAGRGNLIVVVEIEGAD